MIMVMPRFATEKTVNPAVLALPFIQGSDKGSDMGFIYKLTFKSKKCYIGLTTKEPDFRYLQHSNNAERGVELPVYRAWRKHGSPMMSILFETDNDEELALKEIQFIDELNTLNPTGYNLSYGGDTSPMKNPDVVSSQQAARKAGKGFLMTSETKRKISTTLKQKYADGYIPVNKGKPMSEKQKFRISITKRGCKGPRLGVKVSDETRKKMSESAKRRCATPEGMTNVSEAGWRGAISRWNKF